MALATVAYETRLVLYERIATQRKSDVALLNSAGGCNAARSSGIFLDGATLHSAEMIMKNARDQAFYETSKSISQIEDSDLRRDFAEVLAGAEFGVQNRNAEVTNTCVVALKNMALFLCRTIGGTAAGEILEGLVADIERPDSGVSALIVGEIKWKDNSTCSGGGGGCISKKNRKCLFDGGSGCASKGATRNTFTAVTAWGVILLDEA